MSDPFDYNAAVAELVLARADLDTQTTAYNAAYDGWQTAKANYQILLDAVVTAVSEAGAD